jgi:hypothetical protein
MPAYSLFIPAVKRDDHQYVTGLFPGAQFQIPYEEQGNPARNRETFYKMPFFGKESSLNTDKANWPVFFQAVKALISIGSTSWMRRRNCGEASRLPVLADQPDDSSVSQCICEDRRVNGHCQHCYSAKQRIS